jgi:hypothetical protein
VDPNAGARWFVNVNNSTTSGSSKTTYFASYSPLDLASTATDQAGKSKTVVFDGMGRIAQVTENGINAVTTYHSDLLDHIQEVWSSASSFGCTGAGSRCGFSAIPITHSHLKPITHSPAIPISVLP